MLDINKLQKFQEELIERIHKEFYENLDAEVIQFVISKFFKKQFTENRARLTVQPSSRVLNNWEKEEIIPKRNPSEGKMRQANRVDAIWLELVIQCREFGLPLEQIKNLRKKLFTNILKKFTPLEYGLMHSIIEEAMILLVFSDGEIKLMPQAQYSEYVSIINVDTHLHFNLLSLISDEFPNNNFMTLKKEAKSAFVDQKEMQLLYFLRTGDFESIKVRLNEEVVYFLEGGKRIPSKSKAIEVIKNQSFQELEIKISNGEIYHFSRK